LDQQHRVGLDEKAKGENKRASSFELTLCLFGGAKRDRTVDLYNAIVALSQLSYGPEILGKARGIIKASRAGNSL
jgi:hypothetical protein